MIKLLLLSLIITMVSCSSGSPGQEPSIVTFPRDVNEPLIKVSENAATGTGQITLTHQLQSGDLNWSIKFKSQDNNEAENSSDRCLLEILPTGSQENVRFQDSLITPFCSDFEIDPVSTIDNIVINTRNENIEVCLNDICTTTNN